MYTALARQYRPRRFGEVAMQEHVSETLKSAVTRQRVAHAYLFCGPRGVGKTTAARVLAMALNCPRRADDGEPCGACDSCQRIWAGQMSLDVIEIDAASNRGVDDARELRERAMYAPTGEERYKVYIIDEAHMLTREAWNALLKILEEPPPRVIFVFATTEPQKIQQAAPPILSRCQRFDFRRISVAAIVQRLRQVLVAEGIEADDSALIPIARRAEGGLRDALSLLDQVLSFTDRRLTAEGARRVLGLVDEELYLELFGIIAEHRYAEVFRFVEKLLDEGYDLAEFHRGLADALRALLLFKLEGAEAAAAVQDNLREAFAEQAGRFETGDLLRMLAQVAELDAEGRFRKSGSPRLLLEALFLRFAHLDRTVELETLLRAAAAGTEDRLTPTVHASGAHPRTAAGESSATRDQHRQAPESDYRTGSAQGSAGATGAGSNLHPRSDPSAGDDGRGTARGPIEDQLGAANIGTGGGQSGAARAPDRELPGSASRTGPEQESPGGAGTADAVAVSATDSLAAHSTGEPAVARAATAFHDVVRSGTDVSLPRAVIAALARSRVVGADQQRVAIEVPSGVDRLIADPAQRTALERALAERLGGAVTLDVRPYGAVSAPEAAPRITAEQVRNDRLARLVREEPVLGRAVEEWDLELL